MRRPLVPVFWPSMGCVYSRLTPSDSKASVSDFILGLDCFLPIAAYHAAEFDLFLPPVGKREIFISVRIEFHGDAFCRATHWRSSAGDEVSASQQRARRNSPLVLLRWPHERTLDWSACSLLSTHWPR